MFPKHSSLTCGLAEVVTALGACGVEQGVPPAEALVAEGPDCNSESLRKLPDGRITAVTEEAAPVPHCKVAGVIGTETNFELLLPEAWNGKFVMGGGGGFVEGVSAQVFTYAAADFPLAQIQRVAPSSMLD